MKRCGVLLLLLGCLFLTGCWDKVELSELFLVSAVGVDTTEAGGIAVTLEALEVPSGGEKASSPTGVYFSGEGRTVAEAVEDVYHSAEKKLFWAHNQVVILGSEAAKESLRKYLDFFSMENDMSSDTHVVIAAGKAADLLQAKVEGETSVGMAIGDILSPLGRRGNSVVVPVSLLDHSRTTLTEGLAPTIPLVGLLENPAKPGQHGDGQTKTVFAASNQGNKAGSSSGGGSEKVQEVSVAGMAVIYRDRMIGTLDEAETEGLIWLNNDVKGEVVVMPGLKGGLISLEVASSRSKIKLKKEKDPLTAQICLEVELGIAEQNDASDFSNPENMKKLEKTLNNLIQKQVEQVLACAKELQADVLGIGNACYQKAPKQWDRYKMRPYPYGVAIDVLVESHIISPGNLKTSNAIKKGAADAIQP